MDYEVEMKFPLSDLESFVASVASLGGQFGNALEQSDNYLAHPSRDFTKTDEALRIRSVGADHCVTYKGPKIGSIAKTRKEIELPITQPEEFGVFFAELGFVEVAVVTKSRRHATVEIDGRQIGIDLDEVAGLGAFAELEIVTEEGEIETAQKALLTLAAKLGLREEERRSYLEMLQELG